MEHFAPLSWLVRARPLVGWLVDFYDNKQLDNDHDKGADGSNDFHLHLEAEKFRLLLRDQIHFPNANSCFLVTPPCRIVCKIGAS